MGATNNKIQSVTDQVLYLVWTYLSAEVLTVDDLRPGHCIWMTACQKANDCQLKDNRLTGPSRGREHERLVCIENL